MLKQMLLFLDLGRFVEKKSVKQECVYNNQRRFYNSKLEIALKLFFSIDGSVLGFNVKIFSN